MINYTYEMKQFLAEYVPGHSYKEVTEAFNKKFNVQNNVKAMGSVIKRLGLKNGIDARFGGGRESWNKGRKMSAAQYAKSAPTMFKKGNSPVNHKPVGSERIDVRDGYVHVKVEEPRTWKLKHRVIWEQHNGPIPKDSVIVFKDQNKLNCDINNLMMVKRKYMSTVNKMKALTEFPELNEVSINMIAVMAETNNARKKLKGAANGNF